ncbi:ankyrin repeat domain-containing protein [Candidatus Dependentiae bacterium]|nr:ankyrin repeat domain-containing protein [Candidatus Dependentiae bacterium]
MNLKIWLNLFLLSSFLNCDAMEQLEEFPTYNLPAELQVKIFDFQLPIFAKSLINPENSLTHNLKNIFSGIKKLEISLSIQLNKKQKNIIYETIGEIFKNIYSKEDINKTLFNAAKIKKDIIQILLYSGADVNARDDSFGYTALIVASNNGNTEIVKLLIANNADVNARDNEGYTALIEASGASGNGYIEMAKLLIANNANVNASDNNGDTALIWASRAGYTEIVKILIANNANVNASNLGYGDTALILASENGHTEIVKLLEAKIKEQQ